ncbi:MAG: glycoside hydrolase family 140 protein [Bacteroidaceae bacterium]|nr:glycoside hydrolase family 140 protein [Bacteroidaceae bacterium]
MNRKFWLIACFIMSGCPSILATDGVPFDQIKVSANHRFLTHQGGKPFFYLADTAWELFHKLDREEAKLYLEDRAKKGFTVIQAVAIAELDGISTGNAYGHLPFENQNPTKPAIKEGAENDYWDHVDYIVQEANRRGLVIGLLPTWGRYWHDGENPVFNLSNAETYGRWLAARYRNANLIWILGGDRNADRDDYKATIRAMAKGLREGDGGKHLITYHPTGGAGSADFFNGDKWLDFNMRQNGHNNDWFAYGKTYEDYKRMPAKPVIDGEPIYEDHPIAFRPNERGHSLAADCRRALYWNLFGGACGHTYGHHSIWQMYDHNKRSPINVPLMDWQEAILQPGSSQMVHAKRLLLSRPYFTRIPATDQVLVPHEINSAVPGRGEYRFAATADVDSTYILVYAPVGRAFTVRTSYIKGHTLKAWWYDPRTGKAKSAGKFKNAEQRTFLSPTSGELLDWILVIDDATKGYPKPGSKEFNNR